MNQSKFTKWLPWESRNNAPGMKYPGIYIIAHSDVNLSGDDFSWLPDIIYIGMTNAILGLKGRLKQFDNTIIGKTGHGGADRVLYKHQDYNILTKQLFVSICSFKCEVKSNLPSDLRVMGEVSKFEYDCFAQFVELFGHLPEFNDKKKSPKYSLSVARENGC